jgi:hypothetical protein
MQGGRTKQPRADAVEGYLAGGGSINQVDQVR